MKKVEPVNERRRLFNPYVDKFENRPVVLQSNEALECGAIVFNDDGSARFDASKVDSFRSLKNMDFSVDRVYPNMLLSGMMGMHERLLPEDGESSTERTGYFDEFGRVYDSFESSDDMLTDPTVHFAIYPEAGDLALFMENKWTQIISEASGGTLWNENHKPENERRSYLELRQLAREQVIAVSGLSVGSEILYWTRKGLGAMRVKGADPKLDHPEVGGRKRGVTYKTVWQNKTVNSANEIYSETPYIDYSLYTSGTNTGNRIDFLAGNNDIGEPKATVLFAESDNIDNKYGLLCTARELEIDAYVLTDGPGVSIIRYYPFSKSADAAISLDPNISDKEIGEKIEALKNGDLEFTVIFQEFVGRAVLENKLRMPSNLPLGEMDELSSRAPISEFGDNLKDFHRYRGIPMIGEFADLMTEKKRGLFRGFPQEPSGIPINAGIADFSFRSSLVGIKQPELRYIHPIYGLIHWEGSWL